MIAYVGLDTYSNLEKSIKYNGDSPYNVACRKQGLAEDYFIDLYESYDDVGTYTANRMDEIVDTCGIRRLLKDLDAH